MSPGVPHSDEEPEGAILPKDKLVSLCKCDPVLRWMRTCDHILYQALVEILIPDVLRPVPSTLTQAIRNFAKSLEGWLTNAMSDFPQQVIQTKVGVVSAFAQTLRRYTSLNHLAQAARAVLQNTSQINQMLSDLNRVDFANVQVTFFHAHPHSLGWDTGTHSAGLGFHPLENYTDPQNSAYSQSSTSPRPGPQFSCMKRVGGVPWWLSRLRIQHCHCCGMGSVPCPGTSFFFFFFFFFLLFLGPLPRHMEVTRLGV